MILIGRKIEIYVDYFIKKELIGNCTVMNILCVRVWMSLIYVMVKELGCYSSVLAHSVLNWKCCNSVFLPPKCVINIPQNGVNALLRVTDFTSRHCLLGLRLKECSLSFFFK